MIAFRIIGLTSVLFSLFPSPSSAQATFTILNRSSLSPWAARFYYLGYGQLGNKFVVLMPNGTWQQAGSSATGWNSTAYNPITKKFTGAGVLPCYEVSSGQKIELPANIAGARVYFFQVMKSSPLFTVACQNKPNSTPESTNVNGIFGNVLKPGVSGQAPFSYFSNVNNGLLTGASLSFLKNGNLPAWTYSELGAGTANGTIDTSQVDFVGFPMNVTAKKISNPGVSSVPSVGGGVGFSFSPASQVNMEAVFSNYNSFVASLPVESVTGPYTISPRSNYKSLYSTIGGGILINPGNYIAYINPSSFQNFFKNIIDNYMWKPGWTGTINDGGAFGSLPQAGFIGTALKLPSYPGYKGNAALYAIKFSVNIKAGKEVRTVVAYVLSPTSYQILCTAGAIAGCPISTAPWYQVFAADGALNTPTDNSQFKLLTAAEQEVWNSYYGGQGNYSAVVGRLGFIISMAFNHGVAGGLGTPNGLCDRSKYPEVSACWSNQSFWYPTGAGGTPNKWTTLFFSGDTTGNEFSRWLHTAKIGTFPMMSLPISPAVSQYVGAMGMGYGFAADENPTPPNGLNFGQTPSKYDSIVSMSSSIGCNYITIMPWKGNAPNLTPASESCGR